jgi:hypothetical protein
MPDRVDPGRTGVVVGRVVGVLTALVAVASLLDGRETFYELAPVLLAAVGVESGVGVTALFWGNVLVTATARYALCYVTGSLVGVVYDWLDRPGVPMLVAIVLAVGGVDGALATLDTGSALIGAGYVLAWLSYVPVFVWLFDPEAEHVRTAPTRLG